MHSHLKPTWNVQQTLEEVKVEKRDEIEKGKVPRDEDSQSIISYDGKVVDNYDTASIRSRHLDNGYAKRLSPTRESVLDCDFPKIPPKDFTEKESTELKVFPIHKSRR